MIHAGRIDMERGEGGVLPGGAGAAEPKKKLTGCWARRRPPSWGCVRGFRGGHRGIGSRPQSRHRQLSGGVEVSAGGGRDRRARGHAEASRSTERARAAGSRARARGPLRARADAAGARAWIQGRQYACSRDSPHHRVLHFGRRRGACVFALRFCTEGSCARAREGHARGYKGVGEERVENSERRKCFACVRVCLS